MKATVYFYDGRRLEQEFDTALDAVRELSKIARINVLKMYRKVDHNQFFDIFYCSTSEHFNQPINPWAKANHRHIHGNVITIEGELYARTG